MLGYAKRPPWSEPRRSLDFELLLSAKGPQSPALWLAFSFWAYELLSYGKLNGLPGANPVGTPSIRARALAKEPHPPGVWALGQQLTPTGGEPPPFERDA